MFDQTKIQKNTVVWELLNAGPTSEYIFTKHCSEHCCEHCLWKFAPTSKDIVRNKVLFKSQTNSTAFSEIPLLTHMKKNVRNIFCPWVWASPNECSEHFFVFRTQKKCWEQCSQQCFVKMSLDVGAPLMEKSVLMSFHSKFTRFQRLKKECVLVSLSLFLLWPQNHKHMLSR